MTIRLKDKTPSALRSEAELMLRSGEMPALDEVLKAIAEIREEYVPKIIAARRKSK